MDTSAATPASDTVPSSDAAASLSQRLKDKFTSRRAKISPIDQPSESDMDEWVPEGGESQPSGSTAAAPVQPQFTGNFDPAVPSDDKGKGVARSPIFQRLRDAAEARVSSNNDPLQSKGRSASAAMPASPTGDGTRAIRVKTNLEAGTHGRKLIDILRGLSSDPVPGVAGYAATPSSPAAGPSQPPVETAMTA